MKVKILLITVILSSMFYGCTNEQMTQLTNTVSDFMNSPSKPANKNYTNNTSATTYNTANETKKDIGKSAVVGAGVGAGIGQIIGKDTKSTILGTVAGTIAGTIVGTIAAERRKQYDSEVEYLDAEIRSAKTKISEGESKLEESEKELEITMQQIDKLETQHSMNLDVTVKAAEIQKNLEKNIAENNELAQDYQDEIDVYNAIINSAPEAQSPEEKEQLIIQRHELKKERDELQTKYAKLINVNEERLKAVRRLTAMK